jgi:hypothetical protein
MNVCIYMCVKNKYMLYKICIHICNMYIHLNHVHIHVYIYKYLICPNVVVQTHIHSKYNAYVYIMYIHIYRACK